METQIGSSPKPASFVWGGLNKRTKWWRELLLHPCPEIRPFSSHSYVPDAFQVAVQLWSSKWVCQWVSKWVCVWTLREMPGTLDPPTNPLSHRMEFSLIFKVRCCGDSSSQHCCSGLNHWETNEAELSLPILNWQTWV